MASKAEEDGSKCPICFEVYKEPKALVCLHTFCETCIHEYVIKSKEKGMISKGIECPLCRFVTPVDENAAPETWSKGLRTNFALASLLDSARKNLEFMKLEEKNCQPCALQNISSPATVFCHVCNERMCEKCKNVHDNLQFTKNHEPMNIESKELAFSETLQTYQKCEQHGKKIKFYCKNDDTLCCSTCAIVGHRACKGLVELKEMSKDRRSQLQGCILKKQITELENTMKMSSSHLVYENKHLSKQATDLITEWKQVRERMNQKLDEFEDMLKEEIKTTQTTESSAIMVKAVECNDIAGEMRRLRRVLESSEEKCTGDQQYVVMKKVFEEFKLRQSETEQKFADMKSLKLSLHLSQPINELLKSSSKDVFLSSESSVKCIPKCSAKSLTILAETTFEKVTDREEQIYKGMGFLHDERIVIADVSNKKIILMDENLNKIDEKCLPVQPFSLAVTDDDCVVMTTGQRKKLCFYQIDKDNTIKEKQIIPVDYCCDSISLISDNKCVVDTFGTNVDPAHVLTFDGQFSSLNYDFDGISFETCDKFHCSYNEESMQLLITENDRSVVHVFKTKGKDNVKIENDNMVQPEGITHYMNDLFFVCSWETNSVVQLSSQGEVLKFDVLENMRGPYTLCISPNKDKMVVSNSINGVETKLLLFRIQ